MKKLIYLIVFILFGLSYINAQETLLNIGACYDSSSVKLRWSIDDKDVWNEIKDHGFTLSRYTLQVDSVDFSSEEILNSRIILGYKQSPLPVAEWDNLPNQNNSKLLAKQLLYSDSIYSETPDTIKLGDVLQRDEEEETVFVFSMFAADQDFETAEAMALGFTDSNIEPNCKYQYVIETSKDYDLVFDDGFENSWGNWQNQSNNLRLYRDPTKAKSGQFSVSISGNGLSDYMESAVFDCASYDALQIKLSLLGEEFTQSDYVELYISSDGGLTYDKIRHWYGEYHFYNDLRWDGTLQISEDLTNNMRLKIKSNAGSRARLYLDDLILEGVINPSVALESRTTISTHQKTDLGQPILHTPVGSDRMITIEWEEDETLGYLSYDIERSIDSLHFQKINTEPFMFMSTNANAKLINFQDSVADNQTTYYYRIAGYNGYGMKSDYSNITSGKGVEPLKSIFINIDTTIFTDTTAYVTWSVYPDSLSNVLISYDIMVSKDAKIGYQKFNNEVLRSEVRDYQLDEPYDLAYLKVVGYDENGYSYPSISRYINLIDSIPPEVPEISKSQFISESEFRLEWTPSPDADLQGYKVYYANKENGNYLELSPDIYVSTSGNFSIDPKFMVDSIFVKVNAIDLRGNYSKKSRSAGLSRPDLNPPNAPMITKVNATPEGVELTWRYSSSNDVKEHILERKKSGGPGWEVLLEIDKNDESTYPTEGALVSWTDDSDLDQVKYEYRLIAVDEAYNNMSSDLVYAKPFRRAVDGNITDVGISIDSEQKSTSARVQKQLVNLQAAGIHFDQSKSAQNIHHVSLEWEYDLNPMLKEFKIYRAVTGGSLILYETIGIAEAMDIQNAQVEITGDLGRKKFIFKDEDLMKNRSYVYQIMAIHKDLTVSEKSSQVSINVPQ